MDRATIRYLQRLTLEKNVFRTLRIAGILIILSNSTPRTFFGLLVLLLAQYMLDVAKRYSAKAKQISTEGERARAQISAVADRVIESNLPTEQFTAEADRAIEQFNVEANRLIREAKEEKD